MARRELMWYWTSALSYPRRRLNGLPNIAVEQTAGSHRSPRLLSAGVEPVGKFDGRVDLQGTPWMVIFLEEEKSPDVCAPEAVYEELALRSR